MICISKIYFASLVLIISTYADEEMPEIDEGEEFKGLKAEVLIPPPEDCKRYSKKGDLITIHYDGWIVSDKTHFDSSRDGDGEPEVIHLGTREKIEAFDLTLIDMCVGEKRKLLVPSEYAYGIYGSRDGKVGADENIIFTVELIGIRDGSVQGPIEAFENIDKDKDGYLTMDELKGYMKRLAAYLDEIRESIITGTFDEMVEDIMKNNDYDGDNRISESEFYSNRDADKIRDEL